VIIVISVLLLTVLYSVLNCEFLNKDKKIPRDEGCGRRAKLMHATTGVDFNTSINLEIRQQVKSHTIQASYT